MNTFILDVVDFRTKHVVAPCGQLIQDLLNNPQRNCNLSESPWYLELFMVPQELYSKDFYENPSANLSYRAPVQYWIVSDWFGEELKAHNELVTNHWGFYIWGIEIYTSCISNIQVFKNIYNEYLATTLASTYSR